MCHSLDFSFFNNIHKNKMKKKIVFALIMGIFTTGIISFILITLNTELEGIKFLKIWTKAWISAYVIVIPCILIIGPIIEKLVNAMFKDEVEIIEKN